MANKNFVVKNGLELGNTTANGVALAQNLTFSNSTLVSTYSVGGVQVGANVSVNATTIFTGNSTANVKITSAQTVVHSASGRIETTPGLMYIYNSDVSSQLHISPNSIFHYLGSNLSYFIQEDLLAFANTNGTVIAQYGSSAAIVGNTTVNSAVTATNFYSINSTALANIAPGRIYVQNNTTTTTDITGSSIKLGNSTVNSFASETTISVTNSTGGFSVTPTSLSVTNSSANIQITSSTLTFSNSTSAVVTCNGVGILGAPSGSPATANEVGFYITRTGVIHSGTDSSTVNMQVSRQGGGQLMHFRENGTLGGSISIAGATVTYGTFNGSHWSQTKTNQRINIERGTVVETLNEMCTWDGEKNDQLPKFKISDTKKSRNVYGVFFSWDNEDDLNDALISSLGAYVIRIGANTTVNHGDLLQSAGDGTAEPQKDDVIRSCTIAKVTSNTVIETYKDGSYLVPCVLYCG